MWVTHRLNASASSWGTESDCQASAPALRIRSRLSVLSYARLALVPCISMVNGSRLRNPVSTTPIAPPGYPSDTTAWSSTCRLVNAGVRGAHGSRECTEEELREVDRMASEIAERTADGRLGS